MDPKTAQAFAPAGLSSFFEICDKDEKGSPLSDLTLVGARGGGFGLAKGVWTTVTVEKAKTSGITVIINGKRAPEAETTRTVVNTILTEVNQSYVVIVNHKIEVPIGSGFGTSAGGALTAGLALKEALNLPLTFNQIGRIAHVAEVQCQTGLGTVGPLMVSGCALTLEPGAPGISVIDRLPLRPNCCIVSGVIGPIPTKQVLSSKEKRVEVNRYGKKTLEAILDEPSVENFLACCLEFAEKTGFMTSRLRELVGLAEKAGAVGVAQNMVGEAVHALVLEENAEAVAEAFKEVLPSQQVVISKIDFQGARLIK